MVTLAPSSKWRIVDGHVECQRGHAIASDADVIHVQGRRKCRRCHNDRNRRSAVKVHAVEVATRPVRRCFHCGKVAAPNRTKFCSTGCCVRENARIVNDERRAQAAGVAFEPVYRLAIYERDAQPGGLIRTERLAGTMAAIWVTTMQVTARRVRQY